MNAEAQMGKNWDFYHGDTEARRRSGDLVIARDWEIE
jgi:hypothetical protein